jgi:PEGA domain-containing protein
MRLFWALLVVGLLIASASAGPPSGSRGSPSGPDVDVSQTLPPGNATLDLRVTPASASVTINGSTIPLAVNGSTSLHLEPGVYFVNVAASGYRTFTGNVTLGSVEVKFLQVTLPVQPAASGGIGTPSTSFLVAILATAVGAVALIGLYLFLRRSPNVGSSARTAADGVSPAEPSVNSDEGPP